MVNSEKKNETPFKQIALRLPTEFLDRIGRHLDRMRTASPGVNVRRADAIRALIARALDQVEAPEQASRPDS